MVSGGLGWRDRRRLRGEGARCEPRPARNGLASALGSAIERRCSRREVERREEPRDAEPTDAEPTDEEQRYEEQHEVEPRCVGVSRRARKGLMATGGGVE